MEASDCPQNSRIGQLLHYYDEKRIINGRV